MWDLTEDANSIALIEAFYNARKPVAAVCHAPAVGLHRYRGRSRPPVPFLVEDELKRLGGHYEKVGDWQSLAIVDGHLITGQNPASSKATSYH